MVNCFKIALATWHFGVYQKPWLKRISWDLTVLNRTIYEYVCKTPKLMVWFWTLKSLQYCLAHVKFQDTCKLSGRLLGGGGRANVSSSSKVCSCLTWWGSWGSWWLWWSSWSSWSSWSWGVRGSWQQYDKDNDDMTDRGPLGSRHSLSLTDTSSTTPSARFKALEKWG